MESNFVHAPCYADVKELMRTGYWPGRTVPPWAQERADAWDCSAACGAIREAAMVPHIEALEAEVARLRAALERR
jgi:hypothetical protein